MRYIKAIRSHPNISMMVAISHCLSKSEIKLLAKRFCNMSIIMTKHFIKLFAYNLTSFCTSPMDNIIIGCFNFSSVANQVKYANLFKNLSDLIIARR